MIVDSVEILERYRRAADQLAAAETAAALVVLGRNLAVAGALCASWYLGNRNGMQTLAPVSPSFAWQPNVDGMVAIDWMDYVDGSTRWP